MSRSFAVRIHKGTNILPPNSLSAHKRRKERDNNMPSYYVSVSERDNILSPYALFICAKGTILCPPHFCCVSPRISQEGQYIAPFNIFPIIYLKEIIYCPSHARFAQKRRNKRDNITSLLRTYSAKETIILSPLYAFLSLKGT